jgi:hypothetical protein
VARVQVGEHGRLAGLGLAAVEPALHGVELRGRVERALVDGVVERAQDEVEEQDVAAHRPRQQAGREVERARRAARDGLGLGGVPLRDAVRRHADPPTGDTARSPASRP